jgi:hypothetical protein
MINRIDDSYHRLARCLSSLQINPNREIISFNNLFMLNSKQNKKAPVKTRAVPKLTNYKN